MTLLISIFSSKSSKAGYPLSQKSSCPDKRDRAPLLASLVGVAGGCSVAMILYTTLFSIMQVYRTPLMPASIRKGNNYTGAYEAL